MEELRQRLEEKNRLIEKKTQIALQATQERNRFTTEVNEMRDHLDIRDRKINVLQRKVIDYFTLFKTFFILASLSLFVFIVFFCFPFNLKFCSLLLRKNC